MTPRLWTGRALASSTGQFTHPKSYRYAILGDKEQTLKELSRQLKLPGLSAHIFRNDVAFASFWDDPAFLSIVNDPANNAPLPFDRKDTLALQPLVRQ